MWRPLSPSLSHFVLKKMVRVFRGNLSGDRTEGYHQYATDYGTAASLHIRRTLPTDKRQTIGNTAAQKQQKENFKIANELWKGWNHLQRDFFRRVTIVDVKLDNSGREIRRALTGQRFARHDIIEQLNSPTSPYEDPLPFCICASYCNGSPAPGFTLEISTENLPEFTYEEQNNEGGCFPASAVSPRYEPYLLELGEATYGPWTAQQIHDTRTLCVYIFTQMCGVTSGVWVCGGTCNVYTCKLDFAAFDIKKEEIQARVPLSHKRLSLNDADVYVTVNGVEIWRDWTRYKSRVYPEIYFTAHDGDEVKVWIEKTEGNQTQVSVWNMTVEGINI